MLNASQAFHDHIIDGVSEQNFILKYPVWNEVQMSRQYPPCFISSNDHDIEASGVNISMPFNSSEDLTFGECPASTLGMTILNTYKNIGTVPWGEWKAYIGVKLSEEDAELPEGAIAYAEVQGVSWENYAYSDGEKIHKVVRGVDYVLEWSSSSGRSGEVLGNFTSVIFYGQHYYFFCDTYVVVTDTNGSKSATLYEMPAFMMSKMRTPHSISFKFETSSVGATVKEWANGRVETWEYVPVGVYNIKKPLKTLSETVTITDAFDRMSIFDEDATEWIQSVTFPKTAKQLLIDLLNHVYNSHFESASRSPLLPVFPTEYDENYTVNPITFSCTYRQILSWLAEKAHRVARFNGQGDLKFIPIGGSSVQTIPANRIRRNGLDIGEYIAHAPTKLVNKTLPGLMYTQGEGDNIYYILGNPFIQGQDADFFDEVTNLPEYAPSMIEVIEHDPTIEPGDMITFKYFVNSTFAAVADSLRRLVADSNGRVIITDLPDGTIEVSETIPVMDQLIKWNGATRGTITATGNPKRLTPEEMLNADYNTNTANNPEGIIEKIKAVGIEADYIKGGTLEGVEVIAKTGMIGNWNIGSQAIYKDVVDLTDPNIVYRVYLQPPLQSNPSGTWVLSCQRSTNGGQSFGGRFILYSDGSARFGDANISSDGVIRVDGDNGSSLYLQRGVGRWVTVNGQTYIIGNSIDQRDTDGNTLFDITSGNINLHNLGVIEGFLAQGINSFPTTPATSTSWGNGSKFVTLNQNLAFNGVTIPRYTKGLILTSGTDAIFMGVDSSLNFYVAFRNGTTWTARRI